jgi:DNA (cytosine-5)-methyltransferase 1
MQQETVNNQHTAIDIFAGGGGLTVGLKRAGFNVVAAVEINPHAFATYKTNHPEVQAYKQDVRTVKGRSLLDLSPNGRVDLLSGCPPCQGFSTLTARHKRLDPRNELILEIGRLVEEVQPQVVMMENVPGLPINLAMIEIAGCYAA